MYLKLAWRNIWRNRRRTIITATSVFIAVILALIMRSLQLGAYQRMIDNVVSFYSGHIQIHKNGFWDEQNLDNSFVLDDTLNTILKREKDISNWVPRLESFALASAEDLTKGAMVVGIDPVRENRLTHLSDKIIVGKYLEPGDNEILITEGLAEHLKINSNDTLIILGQGYHGVSAAGKYRIKGIIKFPSPQLNDAMIYLPLAAAQNLYGTGERLTSIAISIKAKKDATVISDLIRLQLNSKKFEVMDWKQMMPEMVQLIEVDNAGGIITISILYMIIAFGIFGTILMMLAERKHEFGILTAIGMKKTQLTVVVIMEILMLSCLGIIAGIIAGIPIISYFHQNPINISGELATAYKRFGMEPVFPFSDDVTIFLSQAMIVLAMSIVLSLYPWYSIRKFKPIDALKS